RTTSAPSDARDVWAAAVVGGLGSVAVSVGAGAVTGIGIRIICNRRRSAGWEVEWSRVEPEWSRRA
ncbi:hypothetical protein ABZW26_27230, partial [Streptomyces sp. NPDC004623]